MRSHRERRSLRALGGRSEAVRLDAVADFATGATGLDEPGAIKRGRCFTTAWRLIGRPAASVVAVPSPARASRSSTARRLGSANDVKTSSNSSSVRRHR